MDEMQRERKKKAYSIPHTLCMIGKKNGKVYKTLETTMGKAQLVMWALNNTKGAYKSVIFETESKQVTDIAIGSDNFPKLMRDIYDKELYVETE